MVYNQIDAFAAYATTDYTMTLAKNAFWPKNELGNYAKRMTTHMCCRFSFPLLQEKFKYNNINEFDFLLLTYEIYKTIFPGFRDMRGH